MMHQRFNSGLQRNRRKDKYGRFEMHEWWLCQETVRKSRRLFKTPQYIESSVLPGRIPPGRLLSMGPHRVDMTESLASQQQQHKYLKSAVVPGKAATSKTQTSGRCIQRAMDVEHYPLMHIYTALATYSPCLSFICGKIFSQRMGS